MTEPKPFAEAVKKVAALYGMDEDVVAEVFAGLLKQRVFNWRKL